MPNFNRSTVLSIGCFGCVRWGELPWKSPSLLSSASSRNYQRQQAVVGRSFRHWRHYEILHCCVLIARRPTVGLLEGTDLWALEVDYQVFLKVELNGVYLDWSFWGNILKTKKKKSTRTTLLQNQTTRAVPSHKIYLHSFCQRAFPKSPINPDLGQFPLRERVHCSETNPWSRPRSSSLVSRQAYFGYGVSKYTATWHPPTPTTG